MSTKEFGTDNQLETKVCYLGTGSNLGNRKKNLKLALELLKFKIGNVIKTSSIYETEPWGDIKQNSFLNQVIEIKTILDPDEILIKCKEIEKEIGRVKSKKWGERIIDIDILYYSSLILNKKKLIIPHPYIQERNFVLIPLNELNRNYIHPVINKSNEELLNKCKDQSKIIKYGN